MKNLLLILVFFSSSIFLKTQSVQMYFCDPDVYWAWEKAQEGSDTYPPED